MFFICNLVSYLDDEGNSKKSVVVETTCFETFISMLLCIGNCLTSNEILEIIVSNEPKQSFDEIFEVCREISND